MDYNGAPTIAFRCRDYADHLVSRTVFVFIDLPTGSFRQDALEQRGRRN
jgi:hypothetical protein